VAATGLRVGLGHHRTLTDDDEPLTLPWFRPLDVSTEPCDNPSLYPLDYINQWRNGCRNTNIYRTLKVFGTDLQEKFLGPFLIDIDNSSWGNGCVNDVADALEATRNIVETLVSSCEVGEENLRVFFSGRKGFNVEVRPEALKISGSITDQIELSAKKLDAIVGAVTVRGNTIIDKIYGSKRGGFRLKHPYIRLHSSINSWIGNEGKEIKRMKFELTIPQLKSVTADKIRQKSEELASSFR